MGDMWNVWKEIFTGKPVIEKDFPKLKIKKDKKNNSSLPILFIILGIILVGGYLFGSNSNKESTFSDELINRNQNPDFISDSFKSSNKLHFDHMPVTYSYDSSCVGPIIPRLNWAFAIIANATNSLVTFKEVNSIGDINIVCYPYVNKEALIYEDATEYTYGMATPTFYGSIIKSVKIEFWSVRNDTMPPDCHIFPRLLIHEILHGFGFDHMGMEERKSGVYLYSDPPKITNRYSIMFPYGGSDCIKEDNVSVTLIATGKTFIPRNEIDEEIVSCLNYIYGSGEISSCNGVTMFSN